MDKCSNCGSDDIGTSTVEGSRLCVRCMMVCPACSQRFKRLYDAERCYRQHRGRDLPSKIRNLLAGKA